MADSRLCSCIPPKHAYLAVGYSSISFFMIMIIYNFFWFLPFYYLIRGLPATIVFGILSALFIAAERNRKDNSYKRRFATGFVLLAILFTSYVCGIIAYRSYYFSLEWYYYIIPGVVWLIAALFWFILYECMQTYI